MTMTNGQMYAAYRCWKASLPISGKRIIDRPFGMHRRTMRALADYELLRCIDELHGDCLWQATRKLDQLAQNCGWARQLPNRARRELAASASAPTAAPTAAPAGASA